MSNDLTEMLARAMHDAYVRFEQAKSLTRADNELLVPWDELPPQTKDASRAFAEGIGDKLARLGYTVVPAPLIDRDTRLLQFSDREVEELARDEHERWVENKLVEDWQFGAEKDFGRKLHPSLVPWGELSEEDREKDREWVRRIPGLMAQEKFQVLRLNDNDDPYPGMEV